MSYGIIEYDEDGKPICEICHQSFHRVLFHVRQKHGMSAKEYKLTYGFDAIKGICSMESSEKSRLKVMDNYDKVVTQNLTQHGKDTRFIKGSKGRTKEKISEQSKIRLTENLHKPKMKSAMKKNGYKLGKSGIGNATRWENHKNKQS
jgi:hypothetical protein